MKSKERISHENIRSANARSTHPSSTMTGLPDEARMNTALMTAARDATLGQLPFGCVVTGPDGLVLTITTGTGSDSAPTGHCEIAAIEEACAEIGGLLFGCTLYSTHEPCMMCCGAINHAKLDRVVYGSDRHSLPRLFRARVHDAKQLLADTSHPSIVTSGVLYDECVGLWDNYCKCAECHTIKALSAFASPVDAAGGHFCRCITCELNGGGDLDRRRRASEAYKARQQ